MNKIETHHKVQAKDNQLFLHHNQYNVDYILEINQHNNGIELTVEFPDDCNLTKSQKDEITEQTKLDFLKEID